MLLKCFFHAITGHFTSLAHFMPRPSREQFHAAEDWAYGQSSIYYFMHESQQRMRMSLHYYAYIRRDKRGHASMHTLMPHAEPRDASTHYFVNFALYLT